MKTWEKDAKNSKLLPADSTLTMVDVGRVEAPLRKRALEAQWGKDVLWEGLIRHHCLCVTWGGHARLGTGRLAGVGKK